MFDDLFTNVVYRTALILAPATSSKSVRQVPAISFAEHLQCNVICGELWNYVSQGGKTKQQIVDSLTGAISARNFSSYFFDSCAVQNGESYVEPLRGTMATYTRPMYDCVLRVFFF